MTTTDVTTEIAKKSSKTFFFHRGHPRPVEIFEAGRHLVECVLACI